MKRREFTKLAATAALGSPLLARGAVPQKKPNILFVFADQLRYMELGCYGGKQIPTPNIDRLAREGVRYSHAYSTYPVCSPFRGMLMTGNFPMKNGMVMNDHLMRNPTPYFAEVCKAQGYRTGYIGKWHIDGRSGRSGYIPPERRRGFDYWRTLECTHDYFDSKYYHQDEREPRTWPDYDAISQTESACEFVRSGQEDASPFCLFLAWGPPHDPYDAPQEYLARYDAETVDLRENVADFDAAEKMWRESGTTLTAPVHINIRKNLQPQLRDRSSKLIREWYQGYYAAISTLDDCMGDLLACLEETGQLDNTIIVFTSDHGDMLGSHRQMGKQLPYEESIGIPFLVRYPEKIPQGTETDALFSPVDMMPTIFGLAGIVCPDVDGMDLSAAAMGKAVPQERDAILIMRMVYLGTNWITNGSGPWRGVRTKKWTYARKSDTGEPWMLFDNDADPQQLTNLVADPDHQDVVRSLDAKTDVLLKESGDPENFVQIANLIQREREEAGIHLVYQESLIPPKARNTEQ